MDFTGDMLEEDESMFLSLMKTRRMMMGWMILMWRLKSIERLNTFTQKLREIEITDHWVKKIKTNIHCCCNYTSQARTEASRAKNC